MANKTTSKPVKQSNPKPKDTGRAKPLAAPGGFRGNRKRYGDGGKS